MSAAAMTAARGAPVERDIGADRVSDAFEVRETQVGANVTALAAFAGGCVIGLGDGRVLEIGPGGAVERSRHVGAVTSVMADKSGGIGYSAGQDGALLSFALGDRAGSDAGAASLRASDGQWVTVAERHDASDLVAIAVGKSVTLYRGGEAVGRLSDHPSAVTGMAFSPAGDHIAVSRYDGITVWRVDAMDTPSSLYWKGSAIACSWSPDGRYIAAATQDRELHVWDRVTDRDYRLGGFQAKPRQIDWSADSAFLLSSGADVIAAWPITGEPGAFPPSEIGYAYAAHVSAIAAGGAPDRLAGGFSNGVLLIGDARNGEALVARADAGSEITRLSWEHASDTLWFGDRRGIVGVVRRSAA